MWWLRCCWKRHFQRHNLAPVGFPPCAAVRDAYRLVPFSYSVAANGLVVVQLTRPFVAVTRHPHEQRAKLRYAATMLCCQFAQLCAEIRYRFVAHAPIPGYHHEADDADNAD